jgi:hypothetical protein
MTMRVATAVAALTSCHAAARADYTITATSGGASSVTVGTGLDFDVEIHLDSDGGDVHNSAIYRVVLSLAGIEYTGYAWGAPYQTGTAFDDSFPFIDFLDPKSPLEILATTLAGPGYPAGAIDVELSNVVPSGTMSEGLITTLNLRIPPGYPLEPLSICIEPDFIALGFRMIAAEAGPPLEVTITLAGDLDGDLDVDVGDLVQVVVNWGPCPAPPGPCPGDVNKDGAADVDDLVLVVLNWTS